jgi:DNA-binding IclR family transcriptional regulator
MATKTLQSLERGIDLLFLFSAEKPILSLDEISRALDLPESTAYRLAATLCMKTVLTRSASGKGYGLHASLLRLLTVVRAHLDIGGLALPSLEALARESGETSQLCLLQGNEVVCAEAIGSANAIRFMPEKGRGVPLHTSALGRAVFAFLPESFLVKYLRRPGLQAMTPYTVTDPRRFREILRQIRTQGWAVSFQQNLLGARGVAVPIFDDQGRAIASLGISGPHPRFGDKAARSLVPSLQAHARTISRALGAPLREAEARPARRRPTQGPAGGRRVVSSRTGGSSGSRP